MPDSAAPAADLMMRDSLTGLPNRRALMAALRLQVPAGQGAIILLDLDRFKTACERLQPKFRDKILLDVAARLKVAAGPDTAVYRYAGDAFCLILPAADRDRAAALADDLRAAIHQKPYASGEPDQTQTFIQLTASAAAAAFPLDGRSPTLLIEAAEMALMVAKNLGRNRTAVAGRLDAGALAEIGVFRGLPCPVLVSRVPEQTRLRQAASDVRHVGPGAAFLAGPPGIGKTRLLRELTVWARSEKFVVLSAACQEPRASLPYATLAEQIEGLIASDRDLVLSALDRLAPLHRAALSVVVRDLPLTGPVPAIEPAQYGQSIYDAFGALLDEFARVGPLFLAVDEAEHADGPSFQVLHSAMLRRVPFFLLAASDRPPGLIENSPVGRYFHDSAVAGAQVLTLAPLVPDEMKQMFNAILPDADATPAVVDQIVAASGGTPLYLEETLRSLLLRGRARLVNGRWAIPELDAADLPPDLDGAIQAVARAIPARADSLLTGAAVIGSQIDPDLLQEVLGQDEMELMDLIDEARRSRLLVTSETGENLLTFPAAHARRVRLASSEETKRREIHGRVGVVQEARHGGDTSHLADELAYHYGRAGNEPRARHFTSVARRRSALIEPPRPEGVRRARLEAVRTPLSPEARDHALAFMRHFAAVLKVGRLYPADSQVSREFFAGLLAGVRALLSSAGPGVTFAAAPEGFRLNGEACDASLAADFAQLLDERLIESMTLLKDFDIEKLSAVVGAFAEPFDRARAPEDHWDRYLDRERLEAIDLVQKAYQARDRDTLVRAREEAAVPPEHLAALRDTLRLLKAAVENHRLYPPGHSLIEETTGLAVKGLLELLEKVPQVTLGTAQEDLVVNGRPADLKFFGDGGRFVVKEINRRQLKSVSIKRGLAEAEARTLAQFLALWPDDPAGAKLLAGFDHVEFGLREYERAAEGAQEVEIAPPSKPIRSVLRARKLLDEPYDRFLSNELDEQFPILVEALAYGVGRNVAESLVDRLGMHFHDRNLDHRVQAYNLLSRTLAFSSPGTRKLGVARSAPPLKKRLLEDNLPEAFSAVADVMTFWIPAAATVGCLREVADVTGPALRKRADAVATDPEIASIAEGTLQRIPETGAYTVILAAVQRPRIDERVAAMSILLAIGGEAIQKVVEFLVEEPELTARRPIAMALGLRGEEISGELIKVLTPAGPTTLLVRVLEVAEPLLGPPLLTHLAELAEKGTPEARREILKHAEQWVPANAYSIVRRLLSSASAAMREVAIDMAARMKLEQASAEIGRLLEAALDERLMALCSRYFEAVPNPAVVPLLARIAEKRPRWFGFVKGYAAETRAAAVRALLQHKTRQAEEAAKVAEKDTRVRQLIQP